ncbi:MAG: DUF2834 domain-containing protein [Cyanobacteriota bacterium]
MGLKFILGLIWLVFVAYTLLLAPLDQSGTLTLIEKLVTLQWANINPILVVIFSLMGVWPMIYACLIFIDEQMQDISAWPSFLASNGSGVIGLLPYLILRQPNQEFTGEKDTWLKILDSRGFGLFLSLITTGLLAYAMLAGNWVDFIRQWQTNHFVHLITLDFCLMCVLFPSVLGDDMARRGLRDSRIFWAVTLVPLLGALAYLCLRPPLPESAT